MTSRIINHHGNVEEVSEAAFTPGNWSANVETGEIHSHAAMSSICMVLLNERGAANARLIAAAPELYEALDGIRWKSADRDNMEFAATITYSQMDRIRAALAKARGEQ